MMSKVAIAVGIAYILMGLSLAVAPDWLLSVDWGTRTGLMIAAGMRVVVGIVLLLAAPTSRFPRVFRVIGGLALIAGLLLPFIPLEFWAYMMRFWTVEHPAAFRAFVGVGATLGGGFIAWAAVPKRSDA